MMGASGTGTGSGSGSGSGGRLRLAAAVTAAVAAAGCSFGGVQDLPLPGGADLGSDPYEVTAEFADVLDLVPHSTVRVNDVAVGKVSRVSLPDDGWTAEVTMLVNRKVDLPANAHANLVQSSLLGEKYVQLEPPAGDTARGRLGDGTRIPLERTNRNPEVEEVFGALSMLLNGGGLTQLRTITRELNNALGGNETEIKSLLGRLRELGSSLDEGKRDITSALDGLQRLSSSLAAREQQIETVLDDLGPGLKVLEEQRGALVTMLRKLDSLSDVAVDTVNRSRDDLVASLRALAPTLRKLADSGRDLPASLEVLFTFPFTDEVLTAIRGDYLNAYLSVTAVPDSREVIPPVDITHEPTHTPQPPGQAGARDTRPPVPLPPTGAPGEGE